MIYRKPRLDEEEAYEKLAQHPLQSKAWGDFRESTGVQVERLIGFDEKSMVAQIQVTFHPIPKLPYSIGYCPKGRWPDEVALAALIELGKRNRAILIKLEPDVSMPPYQTADLEGLQAFLLENGCQVGRALFTPHSFILDLTKSEEELLAQMKPKTRYNLRVAEKHGVQIVEDSSDRGFEEYLVLLKETTKRQGFYAHTQSYQQKMWATMHQAGIAHLLKAVWQGQTLVTWILFNYKGRLFYPYGASSRAHKELMASNLMMWEAMRLGKTWGCTSFDLWGALPPNPDPKDPWFGFHNFKEGYGGAHARFVGTFDLVIDPNLYKLYRIADRWRWRWLRFRAKLPF
jgi:lipid II:glycine glycyltransferase (peptidoglycan interpeptide bridge formation enzyme)